MAVMAAAASPGSSIAGLHPADIADAYGLSGGASGLTVGIVIPYDTPTLESDLATFRSSFGLPPCTTAQGCFSKVDQTGGTSYPSADVNWSLEASLDVDAVSSSCPSCKILVVEATSSQMSNLGAAVDEAVSLGASAVSMSWGAPENPYAANYSSQYFTHPGVPLIAATGDSAYPQASMPATLPNVIAVGGTTLTHTTVAGAERQATAAANALTVGNGTAAARAPTAVQEHAATLARAKADLAKAQGVATAAAKALASARTALTAQKKLVAQAATRYKAAAKKAQRSHAAAIRRALASTKASYAAHQKAYQKATALVTSRSRTVTAIAKTVHALTLSEMAAQSVVNTDNALTSTPPTVTKPVTPAPVRTPTPIVTSAPITTPTPPADAPPTASFTATQTSLSTAFDASASTDSDGTIAGYAWNFGDGSSGIGRTVTHAYATAGTYTATLTVTDNGGATDSSTAPITATAPAPATVSAARGTWMETAWSRGASGCSADVAKPTWQTDSACTMRTVADISAVGDANTGLAIYDTAAIAQGYTSDGWLVVGGTSLAAPLIAGMIVRSGDAANYDDASRFYAHPGSFWDVTSGSNGSCSGSSVCTAGVGYDAPTGLGTPKSLSSF